MKTKLLKKVRKRYSIFRIDSLRCNADTWLESIANDIGYPFYIVCDRDSLSSSGFRGRGFKDYDKCVDSLMRMVIHDYSDLVGRNKTVATKVWWK